MRRWTDTLAAGAMALAVCLFASCSQDSGTCQPACPAGSGCQDADGVGAPECVTPEGELACAADANCPEDGSCEDGLCMRMCGCASDMDCPFGFFCVTEDEGCGLCMSTESYSCTTDDDCLAVVDASNCCRCPRPRNLAAVEAGSCLVAVAEADDPPAGCEPDCSGIDHCWPCTKDPAGLTCSGPGPTSCHF